MDDARRDRNGGGDAPIELHDAYLALAAMCIGLFATLMDPALVAVALPEIQQEFGASVNEIFWVSAIFLLTFAVPLLITGRLGDRFGHRRIYLIGMVAFAGGAFASSLAPSIGWLIFFRGVQGLGASLLNPQPLSIINRIFPRSSRGQAIGIWAAVASSASLFGPVIGGGIVGFLNWRWAFALYLPAGLISLVLVAKFVPVLERTAPPIPLSSAALSLIAVLGLIFGLQQGPELGWNWLVWLSLAIGTIVLVIFVIAQHRLGERALMPLALFSHQNFRLATIAVFALGFVNYSFQLPLMLYLQTVREVPAELAALIVVPMGLFSVLTAPISGRLTDRVRPGILSPIGFGLVIVGLGGFVGIILLDLATWTFLIPVSMLGLGIGTAWTPNSVVGLRTLPVNLVGAGSGVYTTSRQIGAVLGVAALGATMQSIASVPHASAAALTVPLVVLVVGLVAVARFADDRED